MEFVKVLSPASVANLVCGFDIMGLSLHEPYDVIEVSKSEKEGVFIKHTDHYQLPENPHENVAGVALQAMLAKSPHVKGFSVIIKKGIKPGSGLGSSAASAAGAVVAANHLLGNIFSKNELVQFAMEGEALASGARHADNLVPGIYGGIGLIRSIAPMDIIQLKAPPLFVSVLHPQLEIKTSEARKMLPTHIPLKAATQQWANVAALVAGLMNFNYELIRRSLNDHIIEPIRSKLIPGFDAVKKRALEAGALGGGISGSGPAIFMLSKDERTAKQVEMAMTEAYMRMDIPFITHSSSINYDGIKLIDVKENRHELLQY